MALAVYALHLWRKVWRQQQAHREKRLAQHERLAGDLRILANSLLDGQLPLIEGAIRIKVLLDNYDYQLNQNQPCDVFKRIYAATAHIPTHQGWKALSKEQRANYEKLFERLTVEHQQAAHDAARWLLDKGLSNQPRT
ncbi:DUF2489 domain-containing protein [Ectopseudomonas mendocina]|uniref:DUF2489 domain-containing protein n=1 Tax=Ectopseudomonas mendocina TaxID=300 RepID=A0ABZ2RCW1_ECTME